MKRILVLAMAGVMTTLLSCTKNELQLEPEFPTGSENTTPVEFTLTTAQPDTPRQVVGSKSATDQAFGVDFSAPLETKAANELSLTQEQAVLNIWVLQYDGSGNLVGEPCFVTLSDIRQTDATVSFQTKLTASSTAQTLYFIANTNDPGLFTSTNAATVTALNAMSITLSEEFRPSPGEGLPMIGAQIFTGVSPGESFTGITLKRMVAKVTARYKVDPGFDFEVADVSIGNVPTSISLVTEVSASAIHPALVNGSHFDVYATETPSTAGTDGEYRTFMWYMPENHRTASSVSDWKDFTVDKSDGRATYVQVSGTYQGREVSYNAVLRTEENLTDMTVRRNYNYTVTMDINGLDDSDNRIAAIATPANSFMVLPGNRVMFDARMTGNETAASIAPVSVAVVWQDVQGLITSISYNSTTGKAAASTNNNAGSGNALVAAYAGANGTGDILWSWHIWVSDYEPKGQGTVVANRVYAVTGGQVHTYGTNFVAANPGKVIMDRNLGATAAYYAAPTTAALGVQAFGFFYQWGRKDPFPNWDGVGTTGSGSFVPVYDASGSTVTPTFVAGPTTVAASILNPTVFYYYAATPYDWLSTQDDTLWGDGTAKSKYDPCPAGWRIAPTGTWSDFTAAGDNITDTDEVYTGTIFQYWINGTAQTANGTPTYANSGRNGRLYAAGTVAAWYPAPGYLHRNTGVLGSAGRNGYSRSSTASGVNVHHLDFHYSKITPSYASGRAYAFQARCIQE